MSAGQYVLKFEQGAYFHISMIYEDANDVPYDLTGYSAKLQIKARKEDIVVILELSTDNGSIVLGTVDGTIEIIATKIQTSLLKNVEGFYDMLLIPPSGEPERLIEGRTRVDLAVTT